MSIARRRLALVTIPALLAGLTLGGCTRQYDPDHPYVPAQQATRPAPAAPTPTADLGPTDRQRLAPALRALRQRNQGRWETTWTVDGATALHEIGSYRRDTEVATSTRSQTGGAQPLTARAVAIGTDLWVTVKGDGLPTCWRQLTGADLLESFTADPRPGDIAAVLAPLSARAVQPDHQGGPGDPVLVSADLLRVAEVIGRYTPGFELGLTPRMPGRVTISLDIRGGRLVGWSTTVKDLAEAARAAGGKPARFMDTGVSTIEVRLSALPGELSVVPPSDICLVPIS